jgi:hypothetical protein
LGHPISITLDVDWAPDYIIEDVARVLIKKQVKATWFITHASPALKMLRQQSDLFELGIHPNFKEGSSHGKTMPEVVFHCLGLVPEAVSARSHGLIQSDYLWRYYIESTPIRCECSTFLGHAPSAAPSRFFWKRKDLLRIPYNYQDNMEMDRPRPIWDAIDFLKGKTGVQMLDFHPFYIYTNASSMAVFEEVKKLGRPFHELSEEELLPYRRNGAGARSMFVSVLDYLAEHGGGIRVKDILAFDAAGGQTA